jgi:hypothetical protein
MKYFLFLIFFLLGAGSFSAFVFLKFEKPLRGTMEGSRFFSLQGYVEEVRDIKKCKSYFVYESLESGMPVVLFSEKTRKCKQ